jgi:SAM-dependent methyltransferase
MGWDPRGVLASPAVYHAFSQLLGARRSRAEVVRLYVRPRPGNRVLDCGCGPGEFVELLPDVEYVGVDLDERYVAEARRRFGARASFRLGPVGPGTMHEKAHYDLVLAMGLLHHLDDATVRDFLRLARRALKPTGRLVTLDPCRAPGQSRVARLVIDMDRGEHVRSLEEWPPLVEPVFPLARTHVRHDLLRIPYTHVIMDCPVAAR